MPKKETIFDQISQCFLFLVFSFAHSTFTICLASFCLPFCSISVFFVLFLPTHTHTHNRQHATHTTTTMPHTKHSFLSVNPASAMKRECSDMRTCNRPLSCEWFEQEHRCEHPKGGEQCLNMAKSEENLVEARSDTDVCLCLCLSVFCFFFLFHVFCTCFWCVVWCCVCVVVCVQRFVCVCVFWNRERVVLDLFSNIKCVRLRFFGEPLV